MEAREMGEFWEVEEEAEGHAVTRSAQQMDHRRGRLREDGSWLFCTGAREGKMELAAGAFGWGKRERERGEERRKRERKGEQEFRG